MGGKEALSADSLGQGSMIQLPGSDKARIQSQCVCTQGASLSPWKREEGQKIKFLRLRVSRVTWKYCILQIAQSLAQNRISFTHSLTRYLFSQGLP